MTASNERFKTSVSSCSDSGDEYRDDEHDETRPSSADKPYIARARVAVSAEAVGPISAREVDWRPPIYEKTADQRARLIEILRSSFLFSSLDNEEQGIIVDAMEQIYVGSGDIVINKGEAGDFLFVVDKGVLECFKPDDEAVLKTCTSGDVFGELSLLYNAPRAASVRSVENSVLWKLDRKTFTHIVRDSATSKREKHLSFLKSVAILSQLGQYELGQIADALNTQTFEAGKTIVSEGDIKADVFYILESGSADAYKTGFHVMNYSKPGEYFGELALIRDEARAATVKAGPEGCKVLLLDRGAFKRLLGNLEDLIQKHYD